MNNMSNEWEKKFKRMFPEKEGYFTYEFEKFISELLTQERERVVKEILSIKHHTCVSQFCLEQTPEGNVVPVDRTEADFIPIQEIEVWAATNGINI